MLFLRAAYVAGRSLPTHLSHCTPILSGRNWLTPMLDLSQFPLSTTCKCTWRWSGHGRFPCHTPQQIQILVNKARCCNSFCHYVPKAKHKEGDFAEDGNGCLSSNFFYWWWYTVKRTWSALQTDLGSNYSSKLQTTAAASPGKVYGQGIWRSIDTNMNSSREGKNIYHSSSQFWGALCTLDSFFSLQHRRHFCRQTQKLLWPGWEKW